MVQRWRTWSLQGHRWHLVWSSRLTRLNMQKGLLQTPWQICSCKAGHKEPVQICKNKYENLDL